MKLANKDIPAVGLAHISTGAEGLEQLDDLKSHDGDVITVLILAEHVGGVDVVLDGEHSIYTIIRNNQQHEPAKSWR